MTMPAFLFRVVRYRSGIHRPQRMRVGVNCHPTRPLREEHLIKGPGSRESRVTWEDGAVYYASGFAAMHQAAWENESALERLAPVLKKAARLSRRIEQEKAGAARDLARRPEWFDNGEDPKP